MAAGKKLTPHQQAVIARTLRDEPNITLKDLALVANCSIGSASNYKKKLALPPEAIVAREEDDPIRMGEIIDDLNRTAGLATKVVKRQIEMLHDLIEEAEASGERKILPPDQIRALTQSIGVIVQQAQLLQGKPTSISTVLDAEPKMLKELILELLADARGQGLELPADFMVEYAKDDSPTPDRLPLVEPIDPDPEEDEDDEEDPGDGYPM